MRSRRRDLILFRYLGRLTRINSDDPRWRSDIDEEHLGRGVVNRPTCATGDFDFGDALPASDIQDRYRMGIRNQGAADIRGDQDAASGVECEPVRFHSYIYLESAPLGIRCDY